MKAARLQSPVILVLSLVSVVFFRGCGGGTSPPPTDGGQDGPQDGADAPDGLDGADASDGADGADGVDGADGADGTDGGPTAAGPTRLAPTAGSGTVESEGHKARLHVGAPQPMGSASGPGGGLRVGPEARP